MYNNGNGFNGNGFNGGGFNGNGNNIYNGYENQAEGLYHQGGIDYSSPPDFNYKRLMGLGFSKIEIDTCQRLFMQGAVFTPTSLQNVWGYNYETATKLKYLYDIAQGKIEVNTDDELCKHLKKMFGNKRKVSIADLPPSNITEVSKLCLVEDVTDPKFYCLNSGLYPLTDRFYRVLQSTSTKTVIRTQRRPEIKFRDSKETDGVAKILSESPDQDGYIEIEFNPKYTKMCNRYIILASPKCPEFHLGCYELIVVDGSRMYVFGRTLPYNWDLKYKATQERILDCGIIPNEIQPRLERAALLVHKRLMGVRYNFHKATSVFDLVPQPGSQYGAGDDAVASEGALEQALDNVDI